MITLRGFLATVFKCNWSHPTTFEKAWQAFSVIHCGNWSATFFSQRWTTSRADRFPELFSLRRSRRKIFSSQGSIPFSNIFRTSDSTEDKLAGSEVVEENLSEKKFSNFLLPPPNDLLIFMLVFMACKLLLLLLLSRLLLLLLLLLLMLSIMFEIVLTEIRRKAIRAKGENPLGAGAGHSF